MSGKDIYRLFLNVSTRLFGKKIIKKLDARIRFHRKINLKNPTTLSDKLCYLELNVENTLKIKCSDKYEVREYVAEKRLEDILIPLCHDVCSDVGDIDYESLPQKFVMKATHGCGMNLICDDRNTISQEQLLSTANKYLKKDYARACLEPHYQKIPHRIIFERYLDGVDDVIDYKFHCIHGVPEFILVCSNRRSNIKLDVFSLDWDPIDVIVSHEKGDHSISKPSCLDRMIEICKILSADFDFVRVDLYEINNKVFFGELTFSPAAGILPDFNEAFLAEKGKLLQITP